MYSVLTVFFYHDRISKIACHREWLRVFPVCDSIMKEVDNTDKSTTFVDNKFTSDVNNSSNSFRDIVESILVWEHLLNGILIIILLIIFLWWVKSCFLYQTMKNTRYDILMHINRSQPKSERLKNFGKSIQSMLKNLKELRSNQPGLVII